MNVIYIIICISQVYFNIHLNSQSLLFIKHKNISNSLTFAHLASASTFLSQGICTQIGLPCIRSKFGFFVAAQ